MGRNTIVGIVVAALLGGCSDDASMTWLLIGSGAAAVGTLLLLARGRDPVAPEAAPLESADPPALSGPIDVTQPNPVLDASAPIPIVDDGFRARELELARAVQRRMSPQGVVRVPGFAITGYNQMADACGGDWWSCHMLPDGRLLLAVGDVTGHGLASALVAVLARGVVEGVARSIGTGCSPTRVIATLAASMDELRDDQYCMTCCVVVIDPSTGMLSLASAGHPFPYVRRRRGNALEVITARGAPLGSSSPAIGTARARLEPGDLLLLCSDGLADRAGADGRRFGERRIRQLLTEHASEHDTSVRRLRAEILAAVRGFADGSDADDDLTLIVCEYRERQAVEPVFEAPRLVALDDLGAVHSVSEIADTQRFANRAARPA